MRKNFKTQLNKLTAGTFVPAVFFLDLLGLELLLCILQCIELVIPALQL